MRILILERDIDLGERLFAGLRNEDWSLDWTNDADSAKQSLIRDDISLMILGTSSELTRRAPTEHLGELREIRRDTPVVLIADDKSDDDQLYEYDDLVSVQPVDMERIKGGIRMLMAQRTSNADSQGIRNEGQQPVEHFN